MKESSVYFEEGKQLKVFGTVDVLVAGGGVAGLAAAVSAARNGANTLLVERNGVVGGTATNGLMVSWNVMGRFWDAQGEHVVTGIPWEMHRRIIENGGGVLSALKMDTAPTKMVFDREVFIKTAYEMLEESGVQVLLHTQACQVIKEGNKLTGVIIENKSGRQVIHAKQVVDATGEADLCVRAGAECSLDRMGLDHSIMFRIGGADLEKFFEAIKEKKELFVDKLLQSYDWRLFEHDWDAGVLRAVCNSYEDLLAFEAFRHLFDQAVSEGDVALDSLKWMRHPEVRKETEDLCWGFDMQGLEGRRDTGIVNVFGACGNFDGTNASEVSRYKMQSYKQTWIFFEKIIKKIPGFEKSYMLDIASDYGIRKGWNVKTDYQVTWEDIQEGAVFDDVIGRFARGDLYFLKREAKFPRGFDIPYRQILPEGLDNVFVAGKPITLLRAMPACMVIGEAAGTAAALCAKSDTASRNIDIKQLQNRLKNQGVNLGLCN